MELEQAGQSVVSTGLNAGNRAQITTLFGSNTNSLSGVGQSALIEKSVLESGGALLSVGSSKASSTNAGITNLITGTTQLTTDTGTISQFSNGNDCEIVDDTVCGIVQEQKCEEKIVEQCDTLTGNICKVVDDTVCENVEEEECKLVQDVVEDQNCKDIEKENCVDVTVFVNNDVCQTVRDNVCGIVKKTDCKTVLDEACQDKVEVGKVEKCENVTKPKCEKVNDLV